MPMTQTQLADAVAEKAGLSRADAKKAIAALEEVILDEIGNAEKVKIGGVVQLDVRVRPATAGAPGPEPGDRRGDHDLREAGIRRSEGTAAREGEGRRAAALARSEPVASSAGRARRCRARPAFLSACACSPSSLAAAFAGSVRRTLRHRRHVVVGDGDVADERADARAGRVRRRRPLSLQRTREHAATSHSVTLADLAPSTTYSFRVGSVDGRR